LGDRDPDCHVFPLLWLAARCRPVCRGSRLHRCVYNRLDDNVRHRFFGDANFPIAERILLAQAGILAVSLCSFVLAALFAERRQHEAVLMQSEARRSRRWSDKIG
jgi:hypothetical protein